MKQVFCAILMMGLSSAAFASKPYYICSLQNKDKYTTADSEILVQINDGKISIKGDVAGTCIGNVKYMGSEGQYGAGFSRGDNTLNNNNCGGFNIIQWYSTSEGFASIDTNVKVSLGDAYVRSNWADYNCK